MALEGNWHSLNDISFYDLYPGAWKGVGGGELHLIQWCQPPLTQSSSCPIVGRRPKFDSEALRLTCSSALLATGRQCAVTGRVDAFSLVETGELFICRREWLRVHAFAESMSDARANRSDLEQ